MGSEEQETGMSDVTYVLGTVEYVMVEIENETPGVTFVPADWSAGMYLADTATSVVIDDVAGRDWKTASLETVGSQHYAKALIGTDFANGVGTYNVFVNLRPDSGSEVPILKAAGCVTIVSQ